MDSEDEYIEETVSTAADPGIAGRTRKRADNIDEKLILKDNDELMEDDDDDDEELDDDDEQYYGLTKKQIQQKKSKKNQRKKSKIINDNLKGKDGGYSWEDKIKRPWDIVLEDKQGSLKGLVTGLIENNKMKKISKNVTPFQRGIIRTFILIIDCSSIMKEKDLKPNRFSLTIQYLLSFITEYFDQNPISQLGIIGMRNGISLIISNVSGNPIDHITNLKNFSSKVEPKGDPSLQNALEMSRGMLLHTSPHSTKEILIIFGSLFTIDPGDIFKTINNLINDKIRVRIIGLNAQVSICEKIVKETNFGDNSKYGIILNEEHFKDLLNDSITPLPMIKNQSLKTFSLIKMGFPKRFNEDNIPSFCSCHSNINFGGFNCPFCKAKLCSLPIICPSCNLMLISSTHLARSYHHLFPLKNFKEVPFSEVEPVDTSTKFIAQFKEKQCYGCLMNFPISSNELIDPNLIKSSSRYYCEDCQKQFCIDCNVFIHENLHNCPGCETNLL